MTEQLSTEKQNEIDLSMFDLEKIDGLLNVIYEGDLLFDVQKWIPEAEVAETLGLQLKQLTQIREIWSIETLNFRGIHYTEHAVRTIVHRIANAVEIAFERKCYMARVDLTYMHGRIIREQKEVQAILAKNM
ncbi:MAG: hypothetical protein QM811_13460 [Pirellulales bacterium]